MYSATITERFQEVKLYGEKRFKCKGGCGRTLKRQRKFSQTINPFNKTKEGHIKTSQDIYPELKEKLMEWKKEIELCKHCQS